MEPSQNSGGADVGDVVLGALGPPCASFSKIPSSGEVTRIQASPADKIVRPLSAAVCVELCCGSAKLTLALYKSGMDAQAVDHRRNCHNSVSPTIKLDITVDADWLDLCILLSHASYIHVGPPCGTASRAREIPISAAKKRLGVPQPVRSSAHVRGLPTLTGMNKVRTEAANVDYDRIIEACLLAHSRGAYFSVENPRRSYLWEFPEMTRLASPQCACL